MPVLQGHRRVLLRCAATALAVSLLSMATIDGRLALLASTLSAPGRRAIEFGVHVCEIIFAFAITPYLYGLLLISSGMIVQWTSRSKHLASILLFIGFSHVTARFLTDILKPLFSRLRPYETLGDVPWHDTWFAAVGNSFPSGHAVHFWSLFFPLIVVFPRYTAPLAVLPVFISVARVAVNAHYASDVLASAAVAAIVTWAFAMTFLEAGVARSSSVK